MPKALALAIPAYNEADGIEEFLTEVDDRLADWDGAVTFVVVDDRSTDATPAVLEELRPKLRAGLKVIVAERNGGHGPTVLRAYREAVATGADLVLQVDGDGQFDARDIRRVADDLSNSGADVAMAKRRQREDPWFRKVLTRLLRLFLQRRTGLRASDPNCPLRAYRSEILALLLERVPPDAAVPNVYLAILAERAKLSVVELVVEHRERRGDAAQGTMWGKRQRKLAIPKRLLVFVWHALQECRTFLRNLETADLAAEAGRAREHGRTGGTQ